MNNATISLDKALKDDMRIEYYRSHLESVKMAIRYDTRNFTEQLMD